MAPLKDIRIGVSNRNNHEMWGIRSAPNKRNMDSQERTSGARQNKWTNASHQGSIQHCERQVNLQRLEIKYWVQWVVEAPMQANKALLVSAHR